MGMLWHVANCPSIDFVNQLVLASDEDVFADRKSPPVVNKRVTITNMSVKTF